MVDALSQRSKVNAIFMASHRDLLSMIDECVTNPEFKDIMSTLVIGKKEEPYKIKDGYLVCMCYT